MARGGLSREQVNYPWFSQAHAYAAKAGIPYAKYQGLTEMQVKFIMRGLCRKQVEGLDIEPLNLVSRYQLPAAEIFRGCLSHADNLRAVRDFKVSQKVALAMGGYLKFDADCPIGDKKVLETIGSYL